MPSGQISFVLVARFPGGRQAQRLNAISLGFTRCGKSAPTRGRIGERAFFYRVCAATCFLCLGPKLIAPARASNPNNVIVFFMQPA
jgi:hypothetical protein